ncbi:MAG: hypothetical protein JWQ57_2373 [Mucilaginibacter sp.]|nr:hypothetical protein [Mucilaginibacter sp.]
MMRVVFNRKDDKPVKKLMNSYAKIAFNLKLL